MTERRDVHEAQPVTARPHGANRSVAHPEGAPRTGIRLAIASSSNEAQIAARLAPGLAELIHHCAVEASPFCKPAHFGRVLRASGIPAAETISTVDKARDISPARKVRIAIGAVT